MIVRISLDMNGDEFSPEKFLSSIDQPLVNFYSNERVDDYMKWRERQYEFGSISILHPNKIMVSDLYNFPEDYEEWYVKFIEDHFEVIQKSGVTEIAIFWEIFYVKGFQCNFSIFSRQLLKRLSKFDIEYPVSVYALNFEQISDLMKDAEISLAKINEYLSVYPGSPSYVE